MVLSYLHVRIDYDDLLDILKIEPFGASAYNLNYLTPFDVNITIDALDMTRLRTQIDAGQPMITLLKTDSLPHWEVATNHVVVVAGYDDENILIHDPAISAHPTAVSNVAFELAWLGFDYLCASIAPSIKKTKV